MLSGFIYCIMLKPLEKFEHDIKNYSENEWLYDNRLHLFREDEIVCSDGNQNLFFDGHLDNKKDLCKSETESFDEVMYKMVTAGCISDLRGGFCGFAKNSKGIRLFVDHIGNRTLYYYCKNNIIAVSSNFYLLAKVLRYNDIEMTIDEQAVKYMLTLGFMADDTTFCTDIRRVCPGQYVDIDNDGNVSVTQYYMIDNTNTKSDMSMSEAVEGLDYHFRNAVKREFDKDREYGYRHLADLSGGLDSRMVTWVAHDLGYTDQINIAYCRKNYLDFKIAQDIACNLKHKFIFMPLDDFGWYKDIEVNTELLNGSVAYSGSTGARHILEIISGTNCGIEHTGMVGDAIVGSFYSDESYNYAPPQGKENAYSVFLDYDIPESVLKRFDNREQYSLYTRGLLGAQSSYMLRQHYFETSSPFLDVDFLNFILTVPLKLRAKHKLYFEWLKRCYPEAAEYGWETWGGLQPKESNRKYRKKMLEAKRKVSGLAYSVLGQKDSNNMNPIEYWLTQNPETENYISEYYAKMRDIYGECLSSSLLSDMDRLFTGGTAGEREQVVSVYAAIALMLDR